MKNDQLHFVISAPRSGSTWLATALNHHPEIFATEHRLFGRFCEVWRNNDGTTAPRITFDSYARAFGMHYFYQFMDLKYEGFVETFQVEFARFMVEFAQRRTGKAVVIDKITPYPGTAEFVVGQIRKLFPYSKIVQLVRDGRDVLTSGTFDWLQKDAMGTERHDFFVAKKPGMAMKRFFDDSVIERWGRNWLETIQPFVKPDSNSGADHSQPSSVLQIRYESMQSDMAAELERLFATIGVDSSEAICRHCVEQAAFEKMTGGRKQGESDPLAKARKGVVGDWKNYFTRADGEAFLAIVGDSLIKLGYEPDHEWVKKLPLELNYQTN